LLHITFRGGHRSLFSFQIQHAFNYFHRRGKLVYFGPGSYTSALFTHSAYVAGGSSGPTPGGGSTFGPCGGDDPLVRLAVIDCAWFVHRVGRLLGGRLPSRCMAEDLVRASADREADIWLRHRLQLAESDHVAVGVTGGQGGDAAGRRGPTDYYDEFDSPTGRWMLAAMERLEMCITLDDMVSSWIGRAITRCWAQPCMKAGNWRRGYIRCTR
jgi:hypothetical protein